MHIASLPDSSIGKQLVRKRSISLRDRPTQSIVVVLEPLSSETAVEESQLDPSLLCKWLFQEPFPVRLRHVPFFWRAACPGAYVCVVDFASPALAREALHDVLDRKVWEGYSMAACFSGDSACWIGGNMGKQAVLGSADLPSSTAPPGPPLRARSSYPKGAPMHRKHIEEYMQQQQGMPLAGAGAGGEKGASPPRSRAASMDDWRTNTGSSHGHGAGPGFLYSSTGAGARAEQRQPAGTADPLPGPPFTGITLGAWPVIGGTGTGTAALAESSMPATLSGGFPLQMPFQQQQQQQVEPVPLAGDPTGRQDGHMDPRRHSPPAPSDGQAAGPAQAGAGGAEGPAGTGAGGREAGPFLFGLSYQQHMQQQQLQQQLQMTVPAPPPPSHQHMQAVQLGGQTFYLLPSDASGGGVGLLAGAGTAGPLAAAAAPTEDPRRALVHAAGAGGAAGGAGGSMGGGMVANMQQQQQGHPLEQGHFFPPQLQAQAPHMQQQQQLQQQHPFFLPASSPPPGPGGMAVGAAPFQLPFQQQVLQQPPHAFTAAAGGASAPSGPPKQLHELFRMTNPPVPHLDCIFWQPAAFAVQEDNRFNRSQMQRWEWQATQLFLHGPRGGEEVRLQSGAFEVGTRFAQEGVPVFLPEGGAAAEDARAARRGRGLSQRKPYWSLDSRESSEQRHFLGRREGGGGGGGGGRGEERAWDMESRDSRDRDSRDRDSWHRRAGRDVRMGEDWRDREREDRGYPQAASYSRDQLGRDIDRGTGSAAGGAGGAAGATAAKGSAAAAVAADSAAPYSNGFTASYAATGASNVGRSSLRNGGAEGTAASAAATAASTTTAAAAAGRPSATHHHHRVVHDLSHSDRESVDSDADSDATVIEDE